ncbi:MAG: hypothetical protein DMG97_31910, partial [Acidobacteria bacterium]
MERPLAEASAGFVEFTPEARLPTAGPLTGSGHNEASERTLRRMRFGIAGVVPGVGVGLRIGNMLALLVGTKRATGLAVGLGLPDPLVI